MAIIIVIVALVLLVILTILLISHWLFTSNVLNHFKRCNVIVAGKKGSGKDLLFQWVINKRSKENYYANIDYGNKYHNIKLLDVSTTPNDYNRIVNDDIVPQDHSIVEKADIYVSDIGIFLPSYMDATLYKKFPSMPIFYALSRHLYSNNVHCNTQNIERGWKALREQADFYCVCKRTIRLFGWLITKVYTYEKYESAKANLEPIKTRMLNKYSKAEVDIYKATNGEIRKGHIFNRVKNMHYDTRAFEKILLKGDRLDDFPQENPDVPSDEESTSES